MHCVSVPNNDDSFLRGRILEIEACFVQNGTVTREIPVRIPLCFCYIMAYFHVSMEILCLCITDISVLIVDAINFFPFCLGEVVVVWILSIVVLGT